MCRNTSVLQAARTGPDARRDMKKPVAALLGAASLVPATCAIVYVPAWLITGELARLSTAAILCWTLVWLAFAATVGFFIVRVLTSKEFALLQQLLWLVALLSVAPIAVPRYWWQYAQPQVRS